VGPGLVWPLAPRAHALPPCLDPKSLGRPTQGKGLSNTPNLEDMFGMEFQGEAGGR
jgi:hypothetical protein